ncbi:unnamed protein product [Dicrocoelium dendriticum]|nr:unnamed protein product [Dicrocoelium dendriticum]
MLVCFRLHYTARPTEFNEHDVYLCDSKYFEDEKVIRKLKKGLKRFQLSAEAYEDEFFFFLQPICPRKEASPLLDQASPEPLSQEQLNRPASSAITCVVAASAGNSTPQHVFPTSSPATTPHLPTDTVVTSRLMTSPSGPAVGGSDSTFGRNATPMTTVKPNELTDESKLMEHTSDRSKKRRKLRKPPSGYVIYAGEVRKRLLQERRDAPFGEISREVGLLWRQMPASQRDFYERKAKLIKRKMEEEEMRAKAREQELARAQLQQQLAAAPSTVMPTNDRHPSPMVQPFSTVPTLMGAPTSAQPHIVSSSTMSQSLTTPHHSIGTPAPSPTMQFYQTPSGQVIQIVHAPQSTVAGSASSAPGQQAVSSGSGTFSQAAAFTTLPAMSTSCAVPGGTHQVVYQLPGHHPTSVMPSGSMGSSTPQTAYYQQQHQRLLVASNSGHATQGSVTAVMASGAHMPATIMSGVASTPQAQILLASTGSHAAAMSTHPMATHAMSSTHSSVPVLTAAPNVSLINAVQPLQPGVAHEFSPHHHLHHPQFQIVHPASTAIPGHPAHIASAAQAHVPPSIHGAPGQPQQHGRPPSPIFVSTPPRTSRVLHSEVYQRYVKFHGLSADFFSDGLLIT